MGTSLRPDCVDGDGVAMPDDTALFLIRDSLAKCSGLIRGKLQDTKGRHCALGAFWEDYPNAQLNAEFVEKIAGVNDSLKKATPKQRLQKVQRWINRQIKLIASR